MPGYVNRLRVRFDRAGTYRVMCLEFCGMSHHAMKGVVEVKEGGVR
jgi:cytochrome c oxidase subunit 2